MSPRRLLPALGLAALTAAGFAAVRPWEVDASGLRDRIGREFSAYGLVLAAEGPARIRFLPLPRLSFERADLSDSAGTPLAAGGRLSIVLDPLPLLTGRVAVGSVVLDGARISLAAGTGDGRWTPALHALSARLRDGGAHHPQRIALNNAHLVRDGADGPATEAEDLDLDLAWPAWARSVTGSAALTWRGQRTHIAFDDLRPAVLAAGGETPFSVSFASPQGNLRAEGTAWFTDRLKLAGRGRAETPSLPRALAWLGRDAALLPLAGRFTLEGRFETDGAAVMLPQVRVGVGDNVLDGAGQASLATPRAAVQATLAADSLNLAPLLGQVLGILGADGDAAPRIALGPITGGDLDLRLSAAAARIGPVQAEDVAASLLVRDGAVEAALNRGSVQGGTVKGRITLNASGVHGSETEVKAQGSFDQVDLGSLLIDLGAARWVLGPSQGHFTLESSGRDAAELAAHADGRATLTIERGAIVGLDLADVIQRHGGVAAGALARRNGRTAFERASLSLRFADGIGEIADGRLQAATLSANLRGHLSLPERSFRARAELNPRAETARPGPLFDLSGPWDAVAVRAARADEAGPALPPRAARVDGFPSLPSLILPAPARAYAP